MTRPHRWAPLVVLPFLAACGGPSTAPAISVRDSAGISIVEHSAGAIAAAPAWTLGEPSVTIGGGEGEDQTFSFVATAHRLPDGRLVLADNENEGTRFLVYAADGRFERRLGRAGDGPGEFRNARIMGIRGDTLVIYDFMTARVTRMSADGTVFGTTEIARLGPLKIGMPSGLLGDGRILTSPIPLSDTTDHGAGAYRQAGGAQAIDPEGATLDTLQGFPGAEVKLTEMSFGGQRRSFPAPLGYGKRTLYGSDGALVHVATNASSEVATYRLPWAPVRLVRLAGAVLPVDQAARDAQIAEAIANVGRTTNVPEAFRASMIESIRNAGFADSMAHYQSMTVGTDGSLWLRAMRSVADSVPHYLVLGADGRLAARVDLPKGARLMWTDGAAALVVRLNEEDLPRLELRAIAKVPAPR